VLLPCSERSPCLESEQEATVGGFARMPIRSRAWSMSLTRNQLATPHGFIFISSSPTVPSPADGWPARANQHAHVRVPRQHALPAAPRRTRGASARRRRWPAGRYGCARHDTAPRLSGKGTRWRAAGERQRRGRLKPGPNQHTTTSRRARSHPAATYGAWLGGRLSVHCTQLACRGDLDLSCTHRPHAMHARARPARRQPGTVRGGDRPDH